MEKILTVISCGLYRPKNQPAQGKFLTFKNRTNKHLKVSYRDETHKITETTVKKYGKIKIIVPVDQTSLKLQWAQAAEENHSAQRELFVPIGEKIRKIVAFNKAFNYGPLRINFDMGIKWQSN